MRYPLVNLLRKFVANEIDVAEFRDTVENWNRSGLWDQLTKDESKLIANYFYNYFDMYAGVTLPKFGWWERFRRDMRGEGNIDLQALRKGSADLLKTLERAQQE